MRVVINESGQIASLFLNPPGQQGECAEEFIGVKGGFVNGDFLWDEDQRVYRCDQATFERWQRVLNAVQSLNGRLHFLERLHGKKAIYRAIAYVTDTDLDDFVHNTHAALDAFLKDGGIVGERRQNNAFALLMS